MERIPIRTKNLELLFVFRLRGLLPSDVTYFELFVFRLRGLVPSGVWRGANRPDGRRNAQKLENPADMAESLAMHAHWQRDDRTSKFAAWSDFVTVQRMTKRLVQRDACAFLVDGVTS